MAVNYQTPPATALLPVAGVRLAVAQAGIKKQQRDDVTLIVLDKGTMVAGVFTQNHFCAAPVLLSKKHLASGMAIRALLINTGIANAGMGQQGVADALQCCQALAQQLALDDEQILPFSTGVIQERLPAQNIIDVLPELIAGVQSHGWFTAAHAIMTTDTVAKAASRTIVIDGVSVTLTGISKGSGMICPNMATMLAFIATDARLSQVVLDQLLARVNEVSFNAISVDGDTSTNDSFILISTGQAGHATITDINSSAGQQLYEALDDLCRELAQAIVRDGEGATKFITVTVNGGRSWQECRAVAESLAHSPLVKTAFFASDPNLGRLLMAIGNVPLPAFHIDTVNVTLNAAGQSVPVIEAGQRAQHYTEAAGCSIMAENEITLTVDLGRGNASATLWTCDLSHDYVRINAEYRS